MLIRQTIFAYFSSRFLFLFLGILSLSWWLFDLLLKFHYEGFTSFEPLWFCSLILLFIGIAYISKSPTLFVVSLALAIVFQIPWAIDYVSVVMIGPSVNGGADYVTQINFIQFIDTLRHLFTIPLAFYGFLTLWRQAPRAPYLAVALVTIIIFFSRLAPVAANINCSYRICLLPGEATGDIRLGIFMVLVLEALALLTVFFNFLIKKDTQPRRGYWDILWVNFGIAIALALLGLIKLFLLR